MSKVVLLIVWHSSKQRDRLMASQLNGIVRQGIFTSVDHLRWRSIFDTFPHVNSHLGVDVKNVRLTCESPQLMAVAARTSRFSSAAVSSKADGFRRRCGSQRQRIYLPLFSCGSLTLASLDTTARKSWTSSSHFRRCWRPWLVTLGASRSDKGPLHVFHRLDLTNGQRTACVEWRVTCDNVVCLSWQRSFVDLRKQTTLPVVAVFHTFRCNNGGYKPNIGHVCRLFCCSQFVRPRSE